MRAFPFSFLAVSGLALSLQAAGAHAFALGALPPGVYVVQVRAAGAAAWTDARRITVTR